MYNPPRFQSDDHNEAFAIMDANPFATLITVSDGKPLVSQLPLTPKKTADAITLIGHLARANPHSRALASADATVIFHGPHTFITPKWYAENDVPTWNYLTVHATGKVELIESFDGIVECLRELTTHVERHWPSGWDFFVPDDLDGDRLTKNIVGFKIKIENLSFKKKLSQNRSAEDRAGVIRGLATRDDDGSRGVLEEMKRVYDTNGGLK